ncbi:Hypothetical protein NTJ_06362 [Nesidiocoris tenuis]|uniref:Uncharacterized protein n=1 Tax=Nesidiocoris tenuis TaxID=355587 RepID=A0ABN7AMU2_9HEMI|nr:Hypothetical protein NTJ_06362 [Nesidiocoris tenuis]
MRRVAAERGEQPLSAVGGSRSTMTTGGCVTGDRERYWSAAGGACETQDDSTVRIVRGGFRNANQSDPADIGD